MAGQHGAAANTQVRRTMQWRQQRALVDKEVVAGRRPTGRGQPRFATDVDSTLPRSWFQRLASRLLADAGIVTVDEHRVFDSGRLLAELDLAIPDVLIGIECQSWRWHATPEAQRRDAARRRALRGLGWEIVDLWWSDLERIDDVLATVMVIVAERRSK
jgi:hypothetical protein